MTGIFNYIKIFGCKSVLCLDGDLPGDEFFYKAVELGLAIIAADGAVNKIAHLPINLVVGDMDSADPELCKQFNTLPMPSQDSTDFEKSLSHLLTPTVVVGVSGGYIDHVLNNISIFSDVDGIFYAPPIMAKVVHNELTLTLPTNTKLSIFGFPKAQISTKGLRWDITCAELEFTQFSSCMNRTSSPEITINVISGVALLFVYLVAITDSGSYS